MWLLANKSLTHNIFLASIWIINLRRLITIGTAVKASEDSNVEMLASSLWLWYPVFMLPKFKTLGHVVSEKSRVRSTDRFFLWQIFWIYVSTKPRILRRWLILYFLGRLLWFIDKNSKPKYIVITIVSITQKKKYSSPYCSIAYTSKYFITGTCYSVNMYFLHTLDCTLSFTFLKYF